MSSEDKGRLARWAQRKAAARQRRGGAAPAIAEESTAIPATTDGPVDEAKTEPDDAGQPAPEHDLPDIESLGAGSDFSVFMKDGVPAELRRLALRKLWASDPVFNVIDEMVEYGEDYTNAAMVVEGMKSAWEAGRGYARKSVEEAGDGEDDDKGDDKAIPDDAQDQESIAEKRVAPDDQAPEDDNNERG
jgi:hypothetical protein